MKYTEDIYYCYLKFCRNECQSVKKSRLKQGFLIDGIEKRVSEAYPTRAILVNDYSRKTIIAKLKKKKAVSSFTFSKCRRTNPVTTSLVKPR